LAIIVLAVGTFLLRFSAQFLALAAAILITLVLVVPCQIAFQQPALLRRLTDEDQEIRLVKDFTSNYLPPNLGAGENLAKQLILYTAWGRFLAALSFLRLGWYCFAAGSLLVAIYSISCRPRRRLIRAASIVCLPAGALFLLLSLPLI